MSVAVVGSVALDSVRTPFGERQNALGGSATYFSFAASFFTDVKLVGIVGQDFPKEHLDMLKKKKIDITGLQVVKGDTFRWSGMYEYNLNEAKTLETHLNVFEQFHPTIPDSYRDVDCVFLANIDPDLQLDVLRQIRRPKLVAADTMNLWISTKKARLQELMKHVDILILNDGESRQLTGQPSLIKAGHTIRNWGPKYVVIKKGEHGVLLFSKDKFFATPAYPLEEVYDPTGAGDTFAGGFVGYLNKMGNKLEDRILHQALFYGTVMASYNVEDFSLERLKRVQWHDIQLRVRKLRDMTSFSKDFEFGKS